MKEKGIQTLTLRDFQAHGKREVRFGPGVTTIKGATDAGKSAILRALRWVALNQPAGERFVRSGSRTAQVSLEVDDAEIVRIRGSGKNEYRIHGGDAYKAFGNNVPEDVADKLRLGDLNFQQQHDAPFWFSLTAGEVSRQLNQVINLGVIDETLNRAANATRQAKSRMDLTKERLDEAKETFEQAEETKKRIREWEDIEARLGDLERMKIQAEKLEDVVSRIVRIKKDKSAKQAEEGKKVLRSYKTWKEAEESLESLSTLIAKIETKTEHSKPPPSFKPVRSARAAFSSLDGEVQALEDLIERIEAAEEKKAKLKKDHEHLEKRFHEQLKGKECPLCGNLIQ